LYLKKQYQKENNLYQKVKANNIVSTQSHVVNV